jgi:acyl-CoA synthetase (AMP-forming)/AMP-acid ligase II
MNLIEVFQQQVAKNPDRPALVTAKRSISFAELEKSSAQAATFLQQQDLVKGDAILVFQPITIELYEALLGIFRAGMVAMFVDPQSGRDHIQRCCERKPPQGFIGSSKAQLLRLLSASIRAIPKKINIGLPIPGTSHWRKLYQLPAANTLVETDNSDAALLTFTSGSTGLPKAAVRTHGFLLAQHKVLEESIDLQAGQTDLTTLPIFVLANLASGVTSVIPDANLLAPGQIEPAPVIKQIQQWQPDRSAASPAFYERLLDYCEAQDIKLESFKQIYTGGAPVFPRLLARLQQYAPNARVEAVYGSTEAEPIAHVDFKDITKEDNDKMLNGGGLLTGKPVAMIKCRIIADQTDHEIHDMSQHEFAALARDVGRAGEIVVAGDHVLSGYLGGIGDSETKFKIDGKVWHRTGDAGYFDSQRRLWLLGRCSAKLQDKAETLYPFAVETAAYQHDAVKRAAIVTYQEQRVLLLECYAGQQIDTNQLAKQLDWVSLDRIVQVDEIPVDKRHNAKVDYPALKKQLVKILG